MAERELETDEAVEANKENFDARGRGWGGPRTVYVPRADNGFGFTLRHFIVYPPESAAHPQPQDDDDNEDVAVEGQKRKRSKMSALDPMDTIFVKQVKDGGPAHRAGLHKGDRIVSVNGETVTGKTYSQVIGLIQSTDASLKLLVVPRDEDILQMAYQNSVYRAGGVEPHRGDSTDIPEPPAPAAGPTQPRPAGAAAAPPRQLHSYAGRGRHMSDSALSVHRAGRGPGTQQPPQPGKASKYKAELRVLPEDNASQRKVSDPGPNRGMLSSGRASSSSLGSTSSSSGSSQHSGAGAGGYLPATVETTESTRYGYSVDLPLHEGRSEAPTRTSSRNITLSSSSNLQTVDSHSQPLNTRGVGRPTDISVRSTQDMGTVYGAGMTSSSRTQSDSAMEDVVIPEYVAEAQSSAPLYRNVGPQRPAAAHYKSNSQHDQSQARPLMMGTVYTSKATSSSVPGASVASSIRSSSPGPRVPPTGSSTAAFVESGCAQPHSISGAWPGASSGHSRRGSSPTPARGLTAFTNHEPVRRRGTADDDLLPAHLSARPDDGGRGSPASSVHSWPDARHNYNYNHDHRYAAPGSGSGSPSPALQGNVTVRFRDQAGGATTIDVPSDARGATYRSPYSNVTVTASRIPAHLPGYPPHVNLVTERLKRFESEDSMDSVASAEGSVESGAASAGPPRSRPLPRTGYESVASRKSAFEQSDEYLSYEDVSQSKPPRSQRREGHDSRASAGGSKHSPHQANPPPEIMKVPTTPPATISIYFRRDGPGDTAVVTPSPERHPHGGAAIGGRVRRYSEDSSEGSFEHGIVRERSPSYPGESHHRHHLPQRHYTVAAPGASPTSPRRHKQALRQPSYLTAIHSPHGAGQGSHNAGAERAPLATISPLLEEREQLDESNLPYVDTSRTEDDDPTAASVDPSSAAGGVGDDMMPISSCAATTSITTGGVTTTVYMRQPISDRESKLTRRTSYLMATQQAANKPKMASSMSKSDSQLQPTPVTPQQVEMLTLDLSWSPPQELTPVEPKLPATPTRTSNIKKLKAFFGEKTPRIVEATTERSKVFDLPAAGEVVREGYLLAKAAVADGKRAADRSWKPYWVLLRGHSLFLFKDKAAANTSPTIVEEQPISVRSCIVEIAHDYTKKKHVFRVMTSHGSEFLFQADDRDTMLSWIKAIQYNSHPDMDEKVVSGSEVTVRKSSQVTETSVALARGSPQQPQKQSAKRASSKTRSKSPASHSPGVRQKKQSIDMADSPKGKDEKSGVSKTWKGKMVKKFKRYGSSSTAPVEVSGTFGVPLDLCPPSTFSEHIPLVVEVCTRIVEERGIENQGIYRVPGNTGAVNALQDELNKAQDMDDLNLDEDRWLDVNVVSSLLKSFFRKLPEPLITDDLYDMFIGANRHDNPEKRMLRLKKLLHELPDHNFETFHYLATHLNKIASYGAVNKMDARNLAIVFGPTLIRTKEESMVTMVKDMSDQCRIVESVLTHCDWFFSSWDVDIDVPDDQPEEGAMPVSGMNEELLSKAENLELGERGREFSAKDLVSSVISAANRKIKKREKSSKSVSSVDTGSVDSSDLPSAAVAGDFANQPPCEFNERNIDREIELRSMTEDSLNSSMVSASGVAEGILSPLTGLTGHGMASSSTTLTSTLSQERLLQQMVNSTQQRGTRGHAAAGGGGGAGRERRDRARSHERLLSVHSHSAGNLPSMAVAGGLHPSDTLGGSTQDGIYNAKLVYITGAESQPNMASTPQSAEQDDRQTNRQSVHYEVTKYPAYQLEQYQLFQTENAKPQLSLRRGSADSVLSERRGDDEIGHYPSSVSKSRAHQAQQHLKRLQLDAAALRQKDETRRIESEKRALAKHRIELELEKTRAELERDESLEELLAKPTQIAAQIADFHKQQCSADTASLTSTSDYSTMSSTATGLLTQAPGAQQSPPRGRLDMSAEAPPRPDIPAGGKFFMLTSPGREPQRTDTEDPQRKSSGFNTAKIAGKGTLSRRRGGSGAGGSDTGGGDSPPAAGQERRSRARRRSRAGSDGQRRGSLDSNIDLYDSEVSEDFVDSMTSAFDEKLKLMTDSPEQFSKNSKTTDSYTVQYCQSDSCPPQLSLPHSLNYHDMHRNNSESTLFDKYFSEAAFKPRRVGDPKIGIASRFERKDPDGAASPKRSNRDASDPTDSSVQALHGKGTDSEENPEKMGMNLREWEYAQALRRSSEKLYSSKEHLVDIGVDDGAVHQKAPLSPHVVRRKDGAARRKLRRRHTVGGTQDFEHFKALMNTVGRGGDGDGHKTLSAWERLQPGGVGSDAHSSSSGSEAPSIMAWLQQQRLRHVGSSPAVFHADLSAAALRDHDYYSTDLDSSLFSPVAHDHRLQPVSAHIGTPRNPLQQHRYSQPAPQGGYGDSPPSSPPRSRPDSLSSPDSASPRSPKFTFESSI